ncbi:hypothetical protein ABEW60_05395 [Paenibacillus jamilae]|uniref:hypothetical protein n=1 Tax=Paenibacillus jamilae TaxID=114136 RepID=UPI003D2D591C
MPPNMDAYEKLVVQEDRLVKRVCTCEGTTNTILMCSSNEEKRSVFQSVDIWR